MEEIKKVKCTNCGYEMPITYTDKSSCKEIFVKCKGRHCKKVFEIKINS